MNRLIVSTTTFAALFFATQPALAELELEFGGRLQSDVRFRVIDKSIGDFYDRRTAPTGVNRNENILKVTLGAYADRFRGVVDVDIVWLGRSPTVETLEDLSNRPVVDRFRLEAHAAYMEAVDIFVEGLELRVGQQIISWGAGDQFNPTNNLNADDLEDILLFGTQQANLMGKIDYSYEDYFTLTGVLVPIFRPAILPRTGVLAIGAVDRLPHLDPALRQRIHVESAVTESALFDALGPGLGARFPTVVSSVTPVLPENSFENMQFAFRFATNVAEQDLSVSFYQGRSDFPQPIQNVTNQALGTQCNFQDDSQCIEGTLQTDLILAYPKMRVLGFNASGEVDALGWISDAIQPIGYRFELGVYLPEQTRLVMRQGEIVVGNITRPGGEYDYRTDDGLPPLVVDSKPFAKWVLGLDYTFNKNFYLNVQWVHGLVDEFGAGDFFSEGYVVREGGVTTDADETISCFFNEEYGRCAREVLRPRIGDYLVTGLDFRFANNDGLIRLFTILELSGYIEERFSLVANGRVRNKFSPLSAEGFSAVLYPEIEYNFGNGLVLGAGALMQLGKDYTKFGDPGAGGSLVWTRARFSF